MRKSVVEVKTNKDKDGRNLLASWLHVSTCCKKNVSSNTKDHIKQVICGGTAFLLFWLHLDS